MSVKIDPIYATYLESMYKLPYYERAETALKIEKVNQEFITYQEIVEEKVYHYNQIYQFLLSKAFDKGLGWKDYQYGLEICEDLNRIQVEVYNDWVMKQKDKSKENIAFLNEIEDIISRYEKLLNQLCNIYATESLSTFFQKECSITHLVYTNNEFPKIKPYAEAGYMFLCQFHRETKPSFGIRNDKGFAHCFACGLSLNVTSYLMEYENLTYREAVCLLACIYKIDIGHNALYEENNPLVIKYRKTLLSEEYKNLLLKGKERTMNRFLLDDTMKTTRSYRNAVQKFEHDLATIERVKEERYIKGPNKKRVRKKKLVFELTK